MAFLDNSGSINLDAVLTDTGRARMARGDGSFKIVKYAFFDDEIDYELYNKDHQSGSAYYDLNVLQSPILEAFTNNMSYGRSKLLSIPRTNLLYLPVIKLNELHNNTKMHSAGTFVLAVDKDTEDDYVTTEGVLYGENPKRSTNMIRLDQGLDTTEISPAFALDPDLVETQYTVQIDNRLASIVSFLDATRAAVSYVDDDNIASYFFSLSDLDYVRENDETKEEVGTETIAGPRGTILEFKLQSSLELNTSEYLFDTIGSEGSGAWSGYKYIDSNIRISGATTGYTVDIPVRFLKKV
jgi:hypothetical protein